MGMTKENNVDFSKPGICRASDGCADIVKNSDPRRIFKEQGAVVQAQFSGMRTKGSDSDGLSTGVGNPQAHKQYGENSQ